MYLGVVIDKSKVLTLALGIFVFRFDSHYLPHKLCIRLDSDQAHESFHSNKYPLTVIENTGDLKIQGCFKQNNLKRQGYLHMCP